MSEGAVCRWEVYWDSINLLPQRDPTTVLGQSQRALPAACTRLTGDRGKVLWLTILWNVRNMEHFQLWILRFYLLFCLLGARTIFLYLKDWLKSSLGNKGSLQGSGLTNLHAVSQIACIQANRACKGDIFNGVQYMQMLVINKRTWRCSEKELCC